MTDKMVLITMVGGSITGSAVQTNMSIPGKTFSYLKIQENNITKGSINTISFSIWRWETQVSSKTSEKRPGKHTSEKACP